MGTGEGQPPMEENGARRSGFVALIGQANVGKSTFLNEAMGRKLVITSSKPQTTRNRIRCVLTTPTAQIVFVDTPGLHRSGDPLSRRLLREARRSLRGMDLLVYMVEPWGEVSEYDHAILTQGSHRETPMLLLVNKIDTAKGNALEETLLAYERTGRFSEIVPVSALRGTGIQHAVEVIASYLPSGPLLFPPHHLSDQSETFLISELIREKVFRLTHREVPYSTAVRIQWSHEREDGLLEIKAAIIVERESQKGILIGKSGHMIKRIGTLARKDIEALLGRPVFLETVVRVHPNWAQDEDEIEKLTQETR
jgi:GTPase